MLTFWGKFYIRPLRVISFVVFVAIGRVIGIRDVSNSCGHARTLLIEFKIFGSIDVFGKLTVVWVLLL